VLSVVVGLLVWELIGHLTSPVVFAPASAAFSYLLQQTLMGALPAAIVQSLLTLTVGFLLAAVVALPLGFLMGRVAWVHELLQPVLTVIYAVPPVAFIPFLIIWFGLFEQSRIAIVIIMCFFEMLVISMTGARSIDQRLLDVARSFVAPRARLWSAVLVPASMPFLLTALRIGFVRAVAGMITAELLLSPANLGKLLLNSAARFNTGGMLGIIVTVAVIGWVGQYGLRRLEQRVLRWERA
jgi:ABC-type nitrate/sulfonate/bicarbonate transport system permease component